MDRGPVKELQLEKCPTGIAGLDEVTCGGLPRGRPTLVCGGAGCGKTLIGLEFLVSGARDYGEPGVFVNFEESTQELAANVASLGVDLDALAAAKKLALVHIRLQASEITMTGEYDLEGLFVRIGHAIDSVGAKRVVLDTVETLFANLPNEAILRAELQRLFRWLKEKGVTAIVTGERGEKTFTRHGLEEYVADCVILLDHRIAEQIATRRLRIVKYRGSRHGVDEYPFLIDAQGVSVLPITSLQLHHAVSSERVSSGVPRLDAMLAGGYYRGSSILVSGTAGTGKSSLAATFVDAACRRGEHCLYFAMEESGPQIARNMGSLGLDLQRWMDDALLQVVASRPTACGLEVHLASFHKAVAQFRPKVVVIDPISNLAAVGSQFEVKAMLTRLVDFLKEKGVTALMTDLTQGGGAAEATASHVSSLIDTWLVLRDVESSGERNRLLYLLKSRGMAHSNQAREFLITSRGLELMDVYLGAAGVVTGTARQIQEASEQAAVLVRRQEISSRRRDLERRREAVEAKIMALRAESAADMSEAEALIAQEERREGRLTQDRTERAESRRADGEGAKP